MALLDLWLFLLWFSGMGTCYYLYRLVELWEAGEFEVPHNVPEGKARVHEV